ncbi:hypothetical protein SAMD00019534_053850 [Acytostelium subglobosum LB1]|uniref:hypothetical protein n=1 Tax=Acytostelium subglobosum LB1 TaxID=1410327 RepID=UPI000644DE3F|nr:hypothetical protein SAMD00019534_053850 [Acytostelium subglobosum LB1]GAM22210.1 hypothetical protein SAMD00019534_053850 [Acytostelium subglobosum LB1]|eukprot:XP_012755310.1 hypothetical protein SAMD00019534_053850 [Acytostelium subglobosum LB1]
MTDANTDFWKDTWYGFDRFTGHVYGKDVAEDFVFQVRVNAQFKELYDQAGIMIVIDKSTWVKTGIEHNDGHPSIGSVLTVGQSDWATAPYSGDANRFWMRVTVTNGCLRIQFSTDGATWPLLRLCPFPKSTSYFVGAYFCSPSRAGLSATFSDFKFSSPHAENKHLHDLS